MSKQLTLSATVAALSMAVFALSTSFVGHEKAESSAHTASAPLVELSASN